MLVSVRLKPAKETGSLFFTDFLFFGGWGGGCVVTCFVFGGCEMDYNVVKIAVFVVFLPSLRAHANTKVLARPRTLLFVKNYTCCMCKIHVFYRGMYRPFFRLAP